MTMEEHCPHGSGNAAFCGECEREDRKLTADRHKREQREGARRKEWTKLCHGLYASTVAKLLMEHTRGIDYRGSSKRSMGDIWVKGAELGSKLRDRRGLAKKLREASRATKAGRAAKAYKHFIATMVKRLAIYESEYGIKSEEMQAELRARDDDVLEAYHISIAEAHGAALRRKRRADLDVKKAVAQHKVVNREIARRRRNAKRKQRS